MKRYQIIYADPPWRYEFSPTAAKAIERHYETMSIDEIRSMPVADVAGEDCALFLWGTWPKLLECLSVMDSWGFKYRTVAFVWVKANKRVNPDQGAFFREDSLDEFLGLGHWTRSNTEFCLLGTKGKRQREAMDVRQVIYAPIGEHSEKPAETRERIVRLCGDLPRIELFARQKTDGWDVWGNEVESDISLSGEKGRKE